MPPTFPMHGDYEPHLQWIDSHSSANQPILTTTYRGGLYLTSE